MPKAALDRACIYSRGTGNCTCGGARYRSVHSAPSAGHSSSTCKSSLHHAEQTAAAATLLALFMSGNQLAEGAPIARLHHYRIQIDPAALASRRLKGSPDDFTLQPGELTAFELESPLIEILAEPMNIGRAILKNLD